MVYNTLYELSPVWLPTEVFCLSSAAWSASNSRTGLMVGMHPNGGHFRAPYPNHSAHFCVHQDFHSKVSALAGDTTRALLRGEFGTHDRHCFDHPVSAFKDVDDIEFLEQRSSSSAAAGDLSDRGE